MYKQINKTISAFLPLKISIEFILLRNDIQKYLATIPVFEKFEILSFNVEKDCLILK